MAKFEHIKIAVKDDFLARQTRAEPVQAIAELIWNSLDAEANNIEIEFENKDLAGGLSKIVVYDDGTGFSRNDATVHFGNLGGSWKRVSRRTQTKGRQVHGQEGRGRYKAFALGKSAEWKVCYLDKGIEKAERQVFDIVAVSVQDLSPDFDKAGAKTKALHLRLLKSAIEQSPSELQTILNEVLQLSVKKQQELAELLQETTLSSVITAAKTVSERLKFITALENLVFDPETKNLLKERSQLHKIVAENTWIFGEEYNLWVSDKDLKRVLEKHKQLLDPSIVIDEPVKVVGKARGIVDLMLSRAARRHRANDIEHLVVELKAPKVVISADEITQIKKYAHAISADERFSTVSGIKWHFWVVSNNYDSYAKNEIEGGPDPDRRLIHKKNGISVGIKTWGEIIEENRARLQFFQESLQHTADTSTAMKYLQERHQQFLIGVLSDDEHESSASDEDRTQPELVD